MALTKRLVKGSPLTFQEGDNNLQYLEDSILQVSGSYATTGSNTFQGTQTVFGNLVVYGTSSISYTTQSSTNIGNNTITVNTNTPAVRFGGLVVFDSGSTNLSGSMLWDSINQYWIYQNPSGSNYNGGMIISGPKNQTALGQEQGTLLNVITKGQGEDHITSSALIEDGTNLFIAVNTIITGSLTVSGSSISVAGNVTNNLTASYAVSASQAISASNAYTSSHAITSSYTRNADLLDGLDSTQLVLTSSFNTYTSSLLSTTIASIYAATSSLRAATASLYNFSASILNYTASNDIAIASIFGVTGSLNDFSASILNYTASNNANITSLQSYTSSLNLTTGSLQRATASLYNATSSLYNFSASMNSFTASQKVSNGTYATTGSNTFVGSQTVQGSVTVTGNIIAQQYIVSSSQIYITESFSDGSNVFGNSMNDYHQFTGSVYITGSLQVIAGSTNDHFISGGNVGIGTSNPSYQLQTSKAAQNYVAIDNTNDNNRLLLGAEQATTTILSQNLSTLAPIDLKFAVGTTSSLYISSSSNIGIGTNLPTAKLHISGTSGTLLSIANNTTSSLFVSASGFVGIGTSYPSYSLDIQLPNNDVFLRIKAPTKNIGTGNLILESNTDSSTARITGIGFYNSGSSLAAINTYLDGTWNGANITFQTATAGTLSEKMRIQGNGNVGIGYTAPKANLDIGYTAPVSSSMRMINGIQYFQATQQSTDGLLGRIAADYLDGSSQALSGTGAYIDFRRTNTNYGNNVDIVFSTNPGADALPTTRMRITRTGLVGIGNIGPDAIGYTLQVNGGIYATAMTLRGDLDLGFNNLGIIYSYIVSPGVIYTGGTYDVQTPQDNGTFNGIYEVSLTAAYNVGGNRRQASVVGYLYWADDGPTNNGSVSEVYASGFNLSYPATRTVRFTNNTGYTTYSDTRIVIRLVNRGNY